MMILSLVRNYLPSHDWVRKGGWNIADCVERSYDVEGMHVGTVAAGRIGSAVLRRLKPFDMHLHYFDRHRLPDEVELELGVTWHDNVEEMIGLCDVVTINCPLHPETENLFDAAMIAKMKRGAYLVNTARGKIVNRDAIVAALESGQLAGYAGDVWFPQPAPRDHPWRTMPHEGMTPHISGSSLSAQARYAAGTREILECFFEGRPIRDEYLIVQGGHLAGAGAHSYSPGDATDGVRRSGPVRDPECSGRRPALQHLDEARQPGVGLVAVDDAMVDGQRDIGHRPDEDRVLPIDLTDDHALLQLADAEDRGLPGVEDDRRGEQAARHAMVGDGEGAARHVGGGELSGAGAARSDRRACGRFPRGSASRRP